MAGRVWAAQAGCQRVRHGVLQRAGCGSIVIDVRTWRAGRESAR